MKATALLARQLTGVNALLHHVADDLSQQEWTSRPLRGENMPGFIVWHLSRMQDHVVQTWIRGRLEVVQREPLAHRDYLKQVNAGVGITLEEADQIAQHAQRVDVLDYADAVHYEILAWLDTLTDDELERKPDARKQLTALPECQTPGYREETDHLLDQPIWRLLSGPCIGHVRGHLGALALIKTQLRAGG